MAFLVRASGGDGEPWHTPEYTAYLQSPAWQRVRARVLDRAKGRCETCGKPATQVHHLTYERLGHEYMSDLLAVCEPCHLKHDAAYRTARERERMERRQAWQAEQEARAARQQQWATEAKQREAERQQRQAEREYEVELHRWARDPKRYGSSWKLWADKAKVKREFDAWIEERRRLHEAGL